MGRPSKKQNKNLVSEITQLRSIFIFKGLKEELSEIKHFDNNVAKRVNAVVNPIIGLLTRERALMIIQKENIKSGWYLADFFSALKKHRHLDEKIVDAALENAQHARFLKELSFLLIRHELFSIDNIKKCVSHVCQSRTIKEIFSLLSKSQLMCQKNIDAIFEYAQDAGHIYNQLSITQRLDQQAFNQIIQQYYQQTATAFAMGTHARLGRDSLIFTFFGNSNGVPNTTLGESKLINEVMSFLKPTL